ncbi:TNFAIP3-interacting protein 1-like [Trichechus manatus latirostris]|uniref:TNFAIP3-interacting protein 1-like n=1 Tax=Trichechus manatus latirostris TaxID=127582 RepID=A0A2Y9QL68_TRIMA|nr:TNFAIP3-interacting protein 1-like [Trichechus manatus latirostris]
MGMALEEALSLQTSPSSPPAAFGSPEGAGGLLRKQELVTQNELLKQQVKIFEEDFQRERSDRERMNEEKEELKKQVEKLQAQVTLSNAQIKAFKDEEKAKEALKQQKRKAKVRLEGGSSTASSSFFRELQSHGRDSVCSDVPHSVASD